jgi:hypothetical protein
MTLSPKSRWPLTGLLLVLVGLGAWLSMGQPRLTALNASLVLTYPWGRGLGALLAAAGLGALTVVAPKAWMRPFGAVLGLLSSGVALYLMTYRLETTDAGIASRSFFMASTIPWSEVVHVGSEPTLMVVSGSGNRKISIDTTDFSPDQRLVLSRTITRHINELSERASR